MSERIKHKIKCLLELSKQSQFPHEAQAAKTQALTLMRRYNLSEKDLRVAPTAKPTNPEQEYVNALIALLKYKKQIEEYNVLRQKQLKTLKIKFLCLAVAWAIFIGVLTLLVLKG